MEKKKFEIKLAEDQVRKLIEIVDNESNLCDCFYIDNNTIITYDDNGNKVLISFSVNNGTIITYNDNGNKILISFSEYLDSRIKNILNQQNIDKNIHKEENTEDQSINCRIETDMKFA